MTDSTTTYDGIRELIDLLDRHTVPGPAGAIDGPYETVYDDDTGDVSIRIAGQSRGCYTEIAATSQWPDDLEHSPTAELLRLAHPGAYRVLAAWLRSLLSRAAKGGDHVYERDMRFAADLARQMLAETAEQARG